MANRRYYPSKQPTGSVSSEPSPQDWRFQLEAQQMLMQSDMVNLKGEVSEIMKGLQSMQASVSASIQALTDNINARGKTPWLLLIGAGGLLLTIMSGLLTIGWFTINQNVQLSISPLISNAARMAENQKSHDDQIARILASIDDAQKETLQSSLADAQSRVDRAQLNDRMHIAEQHQSDNLADRKAETAALAERSVETEAQFRAEDRIRNTQLAEQQRWNAILWTKLFPGTPYPSITYFPEMTQSSLQPLGK